MPSSCRSNEFRPNFGEKNKGVDHYKEEEKDDSDDDIYDAFEDIS